jgi:hypothetical protein
MTKKFAVVSTYFDPATGDLVECVESEAPMDEAEAIEFAKSVLQEISDARAYVETFELVRRRKFGIEPVVKELEVEHDFVNEYVSNVLSALNVGSAIQPFKTTTTSPKQQPYMVKVDFENLPGYH